MATLQHLIGVVILLVILAIASFATYDKGHVGFAKNFFYFVGIVCACYAVLVVFFGFFWVFAQIGVWLRQIVQWIIEAILFPILFFI